ncbi:hypothetical protein B0I18_105215 [Taibaiella chishuiensis]|uniref:Uncharacterized protein n=1 Tax=Taibaiella chishuiensis TaxID=1434707 RepID=A0A2P8D323_9BACT|nr:hypothetical protein B0I18_105215 [Taibaiella chishuiensis]
MNSATAIIKRLFIMDNKDNVQMPMLERSHCLNIQAFFTRLLT